MYPMFKKQHPGKKKKAISNFLLLLLLFCQTYLKTEKSIMTTYGKISKFLNFFKKKLFGWLVFYEIKADYLHERPVPRGKCPL